MNVYSNVKKCQTFIDENKRERERERASEEKKRRKNKLLTFCSFFNFVAQRPPRIWRNVKGAKGVNAPTQTRTLFLSKDLANDDMAIYFAIVTEIIRSKNLNEFSFALSGWVCTFVCVCVCTPFVCSPFPTKVKMSFMSLIDKMTINHNGILAQRDIRMNKERNSLSRSINMLVH